MFVAAALIMPLLILLAAVLWTWAGFRLHSVRDPRYLPWPARRSLHEGIVVAVVWLLTSAAYWQAINWIMLYRALCVGFVWALVTLYCSTALRQRIVDRANREQGW